jgi:hypothetical protein
MRNLVFRISFALFIVCSAYFTDARSVFKSSAPKSQSADNQTVPPAPTRRADRFGVYNWNVNDSAFPRDGSVDLLNWAANKVAELGSRTEAQTYYEGDLPYRVADYDIRLWLKYRLPVYTYILIFVPTGTPKNAPTSISIDAGGIRLNARFQIACLWRIPARRALEMKSESLLPFVPLMEGGKEELEQGAQALGAIKDEIRRREVALHFALAGSLRYRRDDLLDLMMRTNMAVPIELLRQSEMYQAILKEGRDHG